MVNQQLVDYIKQQSQGGVEKEAVRKALMDAGWPEADVAESMNAAIPAPAAATPVSAPAAAMPITVGASAATVAANPGMSIDLGNAMRGSGDAFEVKPSALLKSSPAMVSEPEHHSAIPMIIMGGIVVVLIAALGYVYFSLSGKLKMASANPGGSDAARVQELETQVQALTGERDGAKGQLADLTEENAVLLNEVAFMAAPTGSAAAEVPANIKGTLSGGGLIAYAVTTPHGLRVTVKNYKDAKVDALLKPLVGTEVELMGTHKPLAMEITVTSANGVQVNPPAPASTSTTP